MITCHECHQEYDIPFSLMIGHWGETIVTYCSHCQVTNFYCVGEG